jgi:hypothetical protein
MKSYASDASMEAYDSPICSFTPSKKRMLTFLPKASKIDACS